MAAESSHKPPTPRPIHRLRFDNSDSNESDSTICPVFSEPRNNFAPVQQRQSSLKNPVTKTPRKVTYNVTERWYFLGDQTSHKNTSPMMDDASGQSKSFVGDPDIDEPERAPVDDFAEKSFFYLTRENRFRRAVARFIMWPWFERISIFVILVNCVTLGAVDPCEGDKCLTLRCKILQFLDHCIFVFFAVEMLIKMLAMGIYGKFSYLAESWNRLDCFIVVAGIAEYIFASSNINLSAIRTIRVLRPLRAINRIPSLRLLVMLLLDTLPMLGNVLLICFFIFFVFGIAGVQLWAGVLRQRCFFPSQSSDKSEPRVQFPSFMPSFYQPPIQDFVCSKSSGELLCNDVGKYEHYDSMCVEIFGNDTNETPECVTWAKNYTECMALGPNPARGTISFDNIGLAWVAIFQVISLEGWTEVMYLIQDSYSFWVWIYFVILIVIGAFFAVNLCLVVIATQFSETKRRELAKMKLERRRARSVSSNEDSMSRASYSETSGTTSGRGNIYTQVLDSIGYVYKLLHSKFKRWKRLRAKNRQKERGDYLYDGVPICAMCRVKEEKLADSQQDSSCFVNPDDKTSLSNFSNGSENWETPPSTPRRSPSPLGSPIDSESIRQSGDVFLSVGSEVQSSNIAMTPSLAASDQVQNGDLAQINYFKVSRTNDGQLLCQNCLRPIEDSNQNQSDPHPKKSRLPKCLQPCCSKMSGCISDSRAFLKKVVEHDATIWIIMLAIAVNSLSMGAEHHNQPELLTVIIETMNYGFTFLFIFELVLKIYVYGFVEYIRDGFNMLDFIIVVISIVELAQGSASGLSVLRTFRLVRIVKLIRFLPALQRQLQVMLQTIDNVATFFMLLSLFIFIFSVLGMSLFGCKFCRANQARKEMELMLLEASKRNASFSQNVTVNLTTSAFPTTTPALPPAHWLKQLDALAYSTCPRANFDSLLWALMTVFQVLTQEAWATVLKDGMYYTSSWAALYFVALVTFGNYVLFNLLIAILVEGLSTDDESDASSMNTSLYPPVRAAEGIMETNPPTIMVEDVDNPDGTRISFVPGEVTPPEPPKRQCCCSFRCYTYKEIRTIVMSHNFFVTRKSYSLYLLSPEASIRKFLVWLVTLPKFDTAVLFVIMLNCIAIAIERPSIKAGSTERLVLDIANYSFNLIFGVEALVKILALGFVVGKDTYLRNGWNVLDFTLIIFSSIDMILAATQSRTAGTKILEIFRVMRLLRALRPLRVINRAPGLKIVVQTLALSVKPIGNIVIICLAFFLIFGILGVQLFRGCFYKCVTGGKVQPLDGEVITRMNLTWLADMTDERYVDVTSNDDPSDDHFAGVMAKTMAALSTVKTKNDCLTFGFEWKNENYNFDNLASGLMTLFVFSTFDGWVKISRDGIDCVGVDMQPLHDFNTWRLVYFISFLLIVGFFILNMFVGVVVNNFQKVRKQIEAEVEDKKREIKAKKLLSRLKDKSDTKKKKAAQLCYKFFTGGDISEHSSLSVSSASLTDLVENRIRSLSSLGGNNTLQLPEPAYLRPNRKEGAKSAGHSPMNIRGQTSLPVNPITPSSEDNEYRIRSLTTPAGHHRSVKSKIHNLLNHLHSTPTSPVQQTVEEFLPPDGERAPPSTPSRDRKRRIKKNSFVPLHDRVSTQHGFRRLRMKFNNAMRSVFDSASRRARDANYWKYYPKWRLSIHRFCTHKYFDLGLAGIIGINVVVMAAEFYLMPREFLMVLKTLNYIFTGIFIVEAIIKTIAFGLRRYLSEGWNQLDVLIVILSVVGIFLEDLDQKVIPINPTIVRVARVFRIARVFKLLKMAKGIRSLLDTVSQALPQVGNLSLLFLLLFFIYASLGVELFGKFDCTYKVCEGLSRHANFHNFGIALLTLFRIATGDNWNGILKDTFRLIDDPESHCSEESDGCFLAKILSPFYFVSFVLIAQFVLINVVVAVLMRQLEDSHTRSELDSEVIAADIQDTVEEVEKIVEENCPEMVHQLQHQIGTDKDDAIALVSTEYVFRERLSHLSDSTASPTVAMKMRPISNASIPSKVLEDQDFSLWQSKNSLNDSDAGVDSEILQKVFEDLGQQLRPEEQREEENSGKRRISSRTSSLKRRPSLIAKNALKLAKVGGELNATDTAELIEALAEMDEERTAIDVFIELRRKQMFEEPTRRYVKPSTSRAKELRRRVIHKTPKARSQNYLDKDALITLPIKEKTAQALLASGTGSPEGDITTYRLRTTTL